MARLAASVVVISAGLGDGFRGLTATSLVSISAEPPLVLVSLGRPTMTRNAVVETRAFNVSVLTRSQEFVAERFAGRAPAVAAAWKDVGDHLCRNGIPLIDARAAWLVGKVAHLHEVGDHDICRAEDEITNKGAGVLQSSL